MYIKQRDVDKDNNVRLLPGYLKKIFIVRGCTAKLKMMYIRVVLCTRYAAYMNSEALIPFIFKCQDIM